MHNIIHIILVYSKIYTCTEKVMDIKYVDSKKAHSALQLSGMCMGSALTGMYMHVLTVVHNSQEDAIQLPAWERSKCTSV